MTHNFLALKITLLLSARNATVNAINQKKLEAIPFPSRIYQSTVQGDFNARLFPAEAALALKMGAQVMLVKNDPDGKYVNGTIGQVAKLEDHTVHVTIDKPSGQQETIKVKRQDWEILKYKIKEDDGSIGTEVVGKFSQFPLRLAWAMTIHKSQGKTFDKVIIDLGKGAFEFGQTYVAFSRCRTLDGIVLKQKLRPRDIMTDERIIDYYERQLA